MTDTGRGIPPESHELVFQEFARLDPEAVQGAGLGLAISRWIAGVLGARITLKSAVGRGSTFALWLPREPPEDGAHTAASATPVAVTTPVRPGSRARRTSSWSLEVGDN